jgi:hypothetical protein
MTFSFASSLNLELRANPGYNKEGLPITSVGDILGLRRKAMYYDPEQNDHGLAHGPFKCCVVPRPIRWISTISADGIHNLAPYSQFQNLGFDPACVMF